MGARQSEIVDRAVTHYMLVRNVRPKITPYNIAKRYGISPSTLYRALQRRKEKR